MESKTLKERSSINQLYRIIFFPKLLFLIQR